MNRQIVKSYIEEYKRNFEQVHDQEIYKWKAIKQFQDNFDIEAQDFYENLELSLSKAGNLLDSGQYFPKRMLLKNVEESPEQIREMFKILYDEDFDILERVENFRSDFKSLNTVNFVDLNDYQDHRAVLVYLTLYYPERYFFYKYRMFKDFADKVEFTYKPIGGRIENIGQFHNLCGLVRYEIEGDQELLNLHENRLDSECYRDKDHNVLTQDFIYAVVRHLDQPAIIKKTEVETTVIEETSILKLKSKDESIDFTPRIINHIQNNIENKRIGDLGERWVVKKEIEYLTENGKSKLADKVKHVAKNQGDGSGFDILSFDLDGNEKYIEVKTTKGSLNSTFYITRNELERSKIEKDKYFLYRVYNFDENVETANLLKIQGELTSICEIPVNYKVTLEK
ncbi:DUF3883 domain-containing protein [Flavobacteriaceae bacterium F89]|uniref:DUF3883 domain-containing protein n=1 Tax=Cerina litoralis TaxID=2874477 RepID=A0AAE3F0C8_9FLAO|nr:DUF3883 domain-containing protein [Cerina litoralis]MCG2462951.1 DUF3883 domain-containing protein [Cerina litoralis]